MTCPQTNQLPLTFDYANSRCYLPPSITSGVYQVTIIWRFSTPTTSAIGTFSVGNATFPLCIYSPSSSGGQEAVYAKSITTPAADEFAVTFFIKPITAGSYFQFDALTGWTLGSAANLVTDVNLFVTEVNPLC